MRYDRGPHVNVDLPRAELPGQPEAVRARPARRRRHRHRHRRATRRTGSATTSRAGSRHYEQVPSVVDEGRLIDIVRWLQGRLWVDRLEATIEAHVMAAARAREACGIPGTSVHTTYLCRDKPAMKEALRAAGVPCARSAGAAQRPRRPRLRRRGRLPDHPQAGRRRRRVGRRAGQLRPTSSTRRSPAAASTTAPRSPSRSSSTATRASTTRSRIDGHVAIDFVTHYYPNVLEAMRTRWISPQFVTTNRIDAPGYDELRELGQRVITALGIGTSATHMEWFAGPKGLYFSEIGCPPARRAGVGPLRRRQRHRHLPRVGQRHRPRAASAARRRDGSPPG